MILSFRKATNNDLKEIVSLYNDSILQLDNYGINQWDEIYPNQDVIKEDINKKQMYVGAINSSIAVTFVLNEETDEEYKSGKWHNSTDPYKVVHRLCVNCNLQNKGIGYKTMQHIESFLSSKNIKAIRLDAFSENPYSLQLYKRLCYNIVGTAHWRKGVFYLMEKLI